MCFYDSLTVFSILELASFVFVFWYIKSTTKESMAAFSFLFCFSAFLGLPFFVEFLSSLISVNLPTFFLILRVRVFIFFRKLPTFCFHFWLPKAHVEVLSSRSVILAALMLKFGICFLAARLMELVLRATLSLGCIAAILVCSDYKVFIAYSSILHMTILGFGVGFFNDYFCIVYLSFHTILSALIFFQFGVFYTVARSRVVLFFRGLFRGLLLFIWLRLPPFTLFVAELLQFQYFAFGLFAFCLFFLIFWLSRYLVCLKLANFIKTENFYILSSISMYIFMLFLYFL